MTLPLIRITTIFVQSQLLIIPSGSLELLPSSQTLSVGKVITWSGPAIAIGGLLFLEVHPLHDASFLQEINNNTPGKKEETISIKLHR